MRIGILGSGLMGSKLGTIWARAGHDVVFSYARSKQKLERLAREANGNARAGTPSDAARQADTLLLAVHWSRVDDVLKQAGDVSGKVIVSCSLPMNADDTDLAIAHTSSGAEALAKKVPKARVVSAFNTVPSEVSTQGHETQPGLLRGRCEQQEDCRSVDPRRGFRSAGRWTLTGRALHGTVHAAHRPTGVRG